VEPIFIFAYRNRIAILPILIRRNICIIKSYSNKIDDFAFNLNQFYIVVLNVVSKYGQIQQKLNSINIYDRKVYSFNQMLNFIKIIVMRKTIINDDKHLFDYIFVVYDCSIRECFEKLTDIIYARLKYVELGIDLNKIFKLEKYFTLLIKVLLFYFLDLNRLLLDIDQIKLILIIENYGIPILKYDKIKALNVNKLSIILFSKDIEDYDNYYEQTYLYSNIMNLYNLENKGINCKNYPYMYKYMDILFTNLKILNIKNNPYY
jgi:hypothetical protein